MKNDLKDWSLLLINIVREEFDIFVSGVSVKEGEIKGGLKQWSVKDEIAHLTFWLEIFAANVAARQNGEALTSTKNYRLMNDEAWNNQKALLWNEVVKNLTEVLNTIENQIKTVSIDSLIGIDGFTIEPKRTQHCVRCSKA